MVIKIDLDLPPPTAGELASALAAAQSAEKAFERRTNYCTLLALVLGLTCLACVAYVGLASPTAISGDLILVVFLTSLFGCIAAVRWSTARLDRTSKLYESMPDRASENFIKVINACLRDELVDNYRQQVVAQGRSLTALEFEAIMKWDRERHQRKLVELAMQNRPLTEADLAATQKPEGTRRAQDSQPTGNGGELVAPQGAAHG